MRKSKTIIAKRKALLIIQSFPTSKGWDHFLTLKKGQRMFFSLFIKKYGLDGTPTKYNNQDILRRIRLVEFFDYFTKQYDLIPLSKKKFIIASAFYKMVLVKVGKKGHSRFELLSFYPI